MTNAPEETGPGSSPGADDEVTVARPEAGHGAGAPIQDGAQELREEAAEVRSEGGESRANNRAASGNEAQRAEQTQVLDPQRRDDEPARDPTSAG